MPSFESHFENVVSLRRSLLAAALCGLFVSASDAAVFYVNQAVAGGNQSGSSWANAEPELGEALETVRTANAATAGTYTEIWVAAGTYKPTHYAGEAIRINPNPWQVIPVPNKESDKAFRLISHVKLYGGFNGTETDRDQRDWLANPTILSGDVGEPGDASDNCNHVVMGTSLDGDVALDGFTITDGNAKSYGNQDAVQINSQRILTTYGAGIFLEGSGWYDQPVKLANLIIRNNRAVLWAGGLLNGESITELTNVHIWENHCDGDGGGIWCSGFAYLALINSSLKGNSSGANGAGIWMAGFDFFLTNCLVTGNYAEGSAGGIWAETSTVLTNVTISGNRAAVAVGGLWAPVASEPYVHFRNSIVTGNTDDGTNPNVQASFEARVSLLGDDWHDATGAVTQPAGSSPGELFVDPVSAANAPTTSGDYRLAAESFAVDRGDDSFFVPGQDPDLSAITTDLDGEDRIMGASIDLGAYESQPGSSAVNNWTIY